ncbi:MAG TPA: hypothetical protein VJG29_01150, partial [Candidatus Paceibacterota bacterium]
MVASWSVKKQKKRRGLLCDYLGTRKSIGADDESAPREERVMSEDTRSGMPATKNEGAQQKGRFTQLGSRFALFKGGLPNKGQEDVEEGFGLFLDTVKEQVNTLMENLTTAWDKASRADPGSEVMARLMSKADELVAEFVSFLGKEAFEGFECEQEDKALAKRVAALYYAGAVWSGGEIPSHEMERALWFLLKTGAMRITHSDPTSAKRKNIRVFTSTWLELPHVLIGTPSSDSRAAEASGFLSGSMLGRIARYLEDDSLKCASFKRKARKNAAFSFPLSVLKGKRIGSCLLPTPPWYWGKWNRHIGGGFFLLSAVEGA